MHACVCVCVCVCVCAYNIVYTSAFTEVPAVSPTQVGSDTEGLPQFCSMMHVNAMHAPDRHVRPRTHTHTHAQTLAHTHTHAQTHAHTHTHTHTRAHTHTHTRTHSKTHTHTCAPASPVYPSLRPRASTLPATSTPGDRNTKMGTPADESCVQYVCLRIFFMHKCVHTCAVAAEDLQRSVCVYMHVHVAVAAGNCEGKLL